MDARGVPPVGEGARHFMSTTARFVGPVSRRDLAGVGAVSGPGRHVTRGPVSSSLHSDGLPCFLAAMPDGTPEDELYAQVGALVRAHRKARGLTMQAVVAKGFVGATAHLSRIERGLANPTLATLGKLAQCFDVPVQSLIPPRAVDRALIIKRIRRLSDDQLRALDGVLQLIEREDA